MPQNVVYTCGLHLELTVCFVHLFDARVLVPVESEGTISQGIHRIRWKHCDRLVHLCKRVPSLLTTPTAATRCRARAARPLKVRETRSKSEAAGPQDECLRGTGVCKLQAPCMYVDSVSYEPGAGSVHSCLQSLLGLNLHWWNSQIELSLFEIVSLSVTRSQSSLNARRRAPSQHLGSKNSYLACVYDGICDATNLTQTRQKMFTAQSSHTGGERRSDIC